MKMYLISDNIDTRTGLRLAGIDGVTVHTREALKTELAKAVSDKNIGILLINEKLSKQFPEVIDDLKMNSSLPLVVEIPDRHGTGRAADFITAYLREAIGVKL